MMNHLCKCGEKNPQNFYKNNKSTCKKCLTERSKQRYHQLSEDGRRAYIDNASKNFKQWTADNTLQYRFVSARNRAKANKMECSITLDDLEHLYEEQRGRCYFTGLKMERCGSGLNSVSLDRLDSTKGYIKDNIVLCIWQVNRIKSNMDVTELFKVVEDIYNQHINIGS